MWTALRPRAVPCGHFLASRSGKRRCTFSAQSGLCKRALRWPLKRRSKTKHTKLLAGKKYTFVAFGAVIYRFTLALEVRGRAGHKTRDMKRNTRTEV